ncbi:MAG: Ger(x)C family spore germination protein [Oscillospiraceae bacterium]|nr:Ger(x)C family spore germination protein [Oscillospiraceae bacterium]
MIKKLVFFIVSALFLISCWDRSEIENKNIVSLIGYDSIDKSEDGNKVKLILVTPTAGDQENTETDITISADGKTFNDALDNISRESSKEVSLDQVKIFLIRKELLNEQGIISEVFDSLLRNPYINRKTYMVAVDSNISDLISKREDSNESIKNYITGLLKNYTSNSQGSIFDINNFLLGYQENKDMLIPTLSQSGDQVAIDYFIAFNNSGIKKDISMENFKICQILKGKNIPILVTMPDEKVDVSLNNNHRKINLNKNNLDISLSLVGEIKQKQNNNFDINRITSHLNEHLNDNIEKVLSICSDYDIDLLGLYDYFYKFHPGVFDKLDLSNSIYHKINISTDANVRIDSKGESN